LFNIIVKSVLIEDRIEPSIKGWAGGAGISLVGSHRVSWRSRFLFSIAMDAILIAIPVENNMVVPMFHDFHYGLLGDE
jgi:hypothetical protein